MNGVAEKKPEEGLKSLQIPEDLDARLDAWCKSRVKVKRATVSRLIERFLAQPDPVKTVLLGEGDEGMESAYADWLEGMAKKLRAGVPQSGEPGRKGRRPADANPSKLPLERGAIGAHQQGQAAK